MSTYSGRKTPPYILLVFLILAILLDRFLIAGLVPWLPGLAAVNLMVVFLDIPVYLPMIDLPVIGLFFLFYFLLLLSYPSRYGTSTWQGLRKRLWRAVTGAMAILLCLSAGGGLYYLCSGLLSRQVRNGIDSFGIRADMYTPVPDHEVIHLQGGMVLLICFLVGLRIFSKRTGGTKEIMQPVMESSPAPSGTQGPSYGTIDPGIAGFQGKRRNPAELEFAELLKQRKLKEREAAIRQPAVGNATREVAGPPDAVVAKRPRTAATSVQVVAPLRVEL